MKDLHSELGVARESAVVPWVWQKLGGWWPVGRYSVKKEGSRCAPKGGVPQREGIILGKLQVGPETRGVLCECLEALVGAELDVGAKIREAASYWSSPAYCGLFVTGLLFTFLDSPI